MKYRDVHGNPFQWNDPQNGPVAKHGLVIDPEWKDAGAGYIARAVSFKESVRESRHIVMLNGNVVADEDLFIAWWFKTVAEGKPALPTTMNAVYPKAVLWDVQTAISGIAIEAQTGEGGPAYRMWIDGSLNGKRITSETIHIGAVDDHVTLDVLWSLEPVGGQPTPTPLPNQPSDAKELLNAGISEMSSALLKVRDAAFRLG